MYNTDHYNLKIPVKQGFYDVFLSHVSGERQNVLYKKLYLVMKYFEMSKNVYKDSFSRYIYYSGNYAKKNF